MDGKGGWMSVKQCTDTQKMSDGPAGMQGPGVTEAPAEVPRAGKETGRTGAEGAQAQKETRRRFFWYVVFFLAVFLAIYLYFILADLSTAPKYVYSQF